MPTLPCPETAAIHVLGFDTSTEVLAIGLQTPNGRLAVQVTGGAAASATLLPQVKALHKYFGRIDLRFFHLLVLLGVPFRKVPGFGALLSLLELADRALLKVQGVRSQAWMMIFEMTGKKS